jgi:hypothetical protein
LSVDEAAHALFFKPQNLRLQLKSAQMCNWLSCRKLKVDQWKVKGKAAPGEVWTADELQITKTQRPNCSIDELAATEHDDYLASSSLRNLSIDFRLCG